MMLKIPPATLKPTVEMVLFRQGIPRDARVSARVQALAALMVERAMELARPKAVIREIERSALTSLLAGEGLNSSDFPLGQIHQQAGRLGLYALTLGPVLCDEIDKLLANDDYAAAAALDTTASLMAENGAGELERAFAALPADGQSGLQTEVVLAYSPGYCGWHTSGQKRLFQYLNPERIGISLNNSCLMSPVKSVSGVLVSAPAPVHLFEPSFTFCEGCRTRSCRARHAKIATRLNHDSTDRESKI